MRSCSAITPAPGCCDWQLPQSARLQQLVCENLKTANATEKEAGRYHHEVKVFLIRPAALLFYGSTLGHHIAASKEMRNNSGTHRSMLSPPLLF